MNDEVLFSLLDCSFPKNKAMLSGYRCVLVSGENYPAIRPEANSSVEGELLTDISARQMSILDEYEGSNYKRIVVSVITDKNVELQCETYAYKPEHYNHLSDSGWCNDLFRQKHMSSYIKGLTGS